jgi:hypothetical protein
MREQPAIHTDRTHATVSLVHRDAELLQATCLVHAQQHLAEINIGGEARARAVLRVLMLCEITHRRLPVLGIPHGE